MFQTKTYVERRNILKKRMGSGLLLFMGNQESSMNYADNTYHFRQDSTFLYYFGLDMPGLAAVIDVDADKEIIFGDDLTVDLIVWMGTHPTIAQEAEKVGVANAAPVKELASVLAQAKSKNQAIHYLPPYRPENIIGLEDLLDIHHSEIPQKASIDFVKAVVDQRNIKSDQEIEEIDKAANVTVQMHRKAMEIVEPGMTEAQVAAAVHEIALASGGNIAFPIIATINGQTLHNHYHGNTCKSGQLFLLDAGAETVMHYAADMSTTVPVDKTFTQRQKEIYQISWDAHCKAVSMLKPGTPMRDCHLASAKVITEGLKQLGLMKGDVDEAVAAGAHALFFPCGLGHMMGLDVHDMEDLGEQYVGYDGEPKSTQFGLKSLRLARPLEPGFVLTIEPGIYFIPELIDSWKANGTNAQFINFDEVVKYKDFGGIRNEEDYVITESGYKLLGEPLPKDIESVEKIRKG